MKITWLGQAGLLLESGDCRIMIDPYLSNSVERVEPKNIRRVPVDTSFFSIVPNIMIFTHNHLDHYDPETVPHFITGDTHMTVLAPASVWNEVRRLGGANNYVQFNRHTTWTERGIRFTAVKAEHSDPAAIGVIIDDGEKKYYVTGDTLYNDGIFGYIPKDIYAVFLPVNGVGNNMNMADAKAFCERIDPVCAVPLHWGMFDATDPTRFAYSRRVIPEIYKEIKL